MADHFLGFGFQTALLSFFFVWVFWTFLKPIVVKHPLNNIPGPPSPSFFTGNFGQVFNPQGWEFHRRLVDTFGGVIKLHGLWGDKQLYVTDPKALHHIIVKDQHVYEEASWFIETIKLIFGIGLLSTLGEHHRKQRKMLNPIFSSNHLREMVPTFYEVAYKLRDAIASKLKGGPQDIDILHWTGRVALELIGQSGLGHSFDNLGDGPPSEYTISVKNLMPTLFSFPVARRLLPYVANVGPPGIRRFLLTLLPSKKVQKIRYMVDVMHQTSITIFQSKKAALRQGDEAVLEQLGRGKDIMSILLKANMEANEQDRLPESELIGQMTTLIFGATDTTSGALARILHVLAQHSDVQGRLRQEITESRANGGDLDYGDLMALPYLDAVIRETLRLFPPTPFVYRTARKDMVLPLLKSIVRKDGDVVNEIFVPRNTNLLVSILGANRNPDIWGHDAYEWKPDRWLSPLPKSVTDAHIPGIYSNLMTFLGGGHACIGFKFAELELKVALSLLLESFSFSLTDQEIVWNLAGILSPTVKGGPAGKFQLPLRVTPVRSK